MIQTLLINWRNWREKEAFYKRKVEKGLKELGEILTNIEKNQAKTAKMREETKEILIRLKKQMEVLASNQR